MTEKDDFERMMEVSGVIPLGDLRTPKQRKQQRAARDKRQDARADEEFEAAMANLDGVVDKDTPAPPPPPDPTRVRHLKFSSRDRLHIDASVDLHGLHRDEAVNRLDLFVRNAFVTGARRLIVVTGKGHHSAGGVGVLRIEVEAWIKSDGLRLVAAFGEAPRAHGGSGALVLELRSRS